MTTDLIHFRRYVQDVLRDRFPGKSISFDELSMHERKGCIYYHIYVWIDRKLCIGTGISWSKAIDDVMAALADYELQQPI
jgi:hypothetical protein